MDDKNDIEMESDKDSTSDDSDDNEEKELLAKSVELTNQLSENKYLYDVYVELIQIFRKLTDFDGIRETYTRFHEVFPLTPELWLEWINAEKSVVGPDKIVTLFDKAVEDYLSIDLWLEYSQYSLKELGVENTRKVLERALTAGGLHVESGSLLWDNLRELEMTILQTLPENSEDYNNQLSKVYDVFKRQLSVPLIGMENTHLEFLKWTETIPENSIKIDTKMIKRNYENSSKLLKKYQTFEDKLVASPENELYHIYKEYLDVVNDPSTKLCLFERAVAKSCLNSQLWQDYCNFALKLDKIAIKISAKALRNCPWDELLWIQQLRIMEKFENDEKKILNCFEQAIATLTPNVSPEIWLTYLEYGHRNMKDREKLYKLFRQALEQFDVENTDYSIKIRRFFARILAKENHLSEAREIWNDILANPNFKRHANSWLEYANLEKQYGDPEHVRKIFQKALSVCGDYKEFVVDEWLMFERECGDLDHYLRCLERSKNILQTAPAPQSSGIKRKTDDHNHLENEAVSKKIKTIAIQEQLDKNPKTTVFISNLYPSITEQRLKNVFPNASAVSLVHDKHGKSRCYGYIQFAMEEEVLSALARDREPLDARPMYISPCKSDKTERQAGFKYSQNVEENKLFVRGLPFDHSETDIKKIFSPYGAKAVRLVVTKGGRSKGLAYIEFENPEMARKAIGKTDGMQIGENQISVAISAPPPVKNKATSAIPSPTKRNPKSRLLIPSILKTSQQIAKNKDNGNTPKTNDDFRKLLLK